LSLQSKHEVGIYRTLDIDKVFTVQQALLIGIFIVTNGER